jgi:hypothetical protein
MSSILGGRKKVQSIRYALDSQLDLKEGFTKRELKKAMEGHILEEVKENYIVLKDFSIKAPPIWPSIT